MKEELLGEEKMEILKRDPQWFKDFIAEWRKRKVKEEKVEG